MSFNYNQVTLVGRLVREPEHKTVLENLSRLKFTMAVNRPKKKDQEEADVDFIPVVLFGAPASIGDRILKKGSPVLIWGRLQIRTYEKENEKMWHTEVVADNFQILERLPEKNAAVSELKSDVVPV